MPRCLGDAGDSASGKRRYTSYHEGGPKGPSGTPHRTAALAAPTPPATPILLAVSVAACFPDLRLRFQCRKFSTPATGTSVTAAKIPPRTALPAAEFATAVKAEVRFADLGAATSAGFMFLPTRVRFMRACSQTTLLGYLARSGALAIDLMWLASCPLGKLLTALSPALRTAFGMLCS